MINSNKKYIFKTVKNKDFSIIANSVIRDERLTFGARGLLIYLLSLPEDWQIHKNHIVTKTPEGITKVTTYFKELRRYGYLEFRRYYISGKISYTEYIVYETPNAIDSKDSIEEPEKVQEVENLKQENLKSDSLKLEKLESENLILEKLTLLRTNNTKNESLLRTKEEKELINNKEEIKKIDIFNLKKSFYSEIENIFDKNIIQPETKDYLVVNKIMMELPETELPTKLNELIDLTKKYKTIISREKELDETQKKIIGLTKKISLAVIESKKNTIELIFNQLPTVVEKEKNLIDLELEKKMNRGLK